MYNPTIKTKFINSYTKSASHAKVIECLFNKIESFESSKGIDICQMGSSDLDEVAAIIGVHNSNTADVKTRILHKYGLWAVENGIENAKTDLASFEFYSQYDFISFYYKNPDDLNEIMDSVYKPVSENTIHNAYRAFLWLAYSGVSPQEMMNIVSDNVNIDNRTVKCGDCSYSLHELAMDSIISCVDRREWYTYKGVAGKIVLDRGVSGSILRTKEDDDTTFRKFMTKMSSTTSKIIKSKHIARSLTYSGAYVSGHFYRMYAAEILGIPVDFTFVAKNVVAGRGKELNSDNVSKTKRQYADDYYAWKKAFCL